MRNEDLDEDDFDPELPRHAIMVTAHNPFGELDLEWEVEIADAMLNADQNLLIDLTYRFVELFGHSHLPEEAVSDHSRILAAQICGRLSVQNKLHGSKVLTIVTTKGKPPRNTFNHE